MSSRGSLYIYCRTVSFLLGPLFGRRSTNLSANQNKSHTARILEHTARVSRLLVALFRNNLPLHQKQSILLLSFSDFRQRLSWHLDGAACDNMAIFVALFCRVFKVSLLKKAKIACLLWQTLILGKNILMRKYIDVGPRGNPGILYNFQNCGAKRNLEKKTDFGVPMNVV